MRISLRDITEYRHKEKCYLIEDENEDYLVIYGTKYRNIIGGELWDAISAFIDGRVGWKFVDKRLRFDRDSEYQEDLKCNWKDYNREAKAKVVYINKLYIDGKERKINPEK